MVILTIDFEYKSSQNFGTYVCVSEDLLADSVPALEPQVLSQLVLSLELLVAVDADVQVQQDQERQVHERELREFLLRLLVVDVERPVSVDVLRNLVGGDLRLRGSSCVGAAARPVLYVHALQSAQIYGFKGCLLLEVP